MYWFSLLLKWINLLRVSPRGIPLLETFFRSTFFFPPTALSTLSHCWKSIRSTYRHQNCLFSTVSVFSYELPLGTRWLTVDGIKLTEYQSTYRWNISEWMMIMHLNSYARKRAELMNPPTGRGMIVYIDGY